MPLTSRYHQETKYRPETVGDHPSLDFGSQPKPFKEFRSSDRKALRSHLLLKRDPASSRPHLAIPAGYEPESIGALSTLLLHTNGVTAIARHGTEQHHFRAAPSAGALYPTEIYVAVRDIAGLTDGIYDYQVQEHALAPVCEGRFFGDLRHATAGHPAIEDAKIVILLSAVFLRSSWRYHDRAYRRILLDTGHVLGNLVAFAPELGLEAVPLGGFDDAALNSLFLFDEALEGMLLMVPLVRQGVGEYPPSRWNSGPGEAATTEVVANSLLVAMHRAGTVRGADLSVRRDMPAPPPSPWRKGKGLPLGPAPAPWSMTLSQTILMRRSTRRLDGPIDAATFLGMLAWAHEPMHRDLTSRAGRPSGLVAPFGLETFIAVNRIDGLASGIYWLAVDTMRLHALNTRSTAAECGQVCLGQDLGSDAAAVVFHAVDLDRLVSEYGDRGYRYVGLDAGHLGHRLQVAAVRSQVGASGIGGYFDDMINSLLSLPSRYGIVYVSCFGGLVDEA